MCVAMDRMAFRGERSEKRMVVVVLCRVLKDLPILSRPTPPQTWAGAERETLCPVLNGRVEYVTQDSFQAKLLSFQLPTTSTTIRTSAASSSLFFAAPNAGEKASGRSLTREADVSDPGRRRGIRKKKKKKIVSHKALAQNVTVKDFLWNGVWQDVFWVKAAASEEVLTTASSGSVAETINRQEDGGMADCLFDQLLQETKEQPEEDQQTNKRATIMSPSSSTRSTVSSIKRHKKWF